MKYQTKKLDISKYKIDYFPKKIYGKYILFYTGKVYSLYSKRFMKPNKNPNGYMRINLVITDKPKFFLIHRLIGLNFLPNPENKPQIDHINRVRDDNRIENLKWATISENLNNKTRYGYTKYFIKQRNRWRVRYYLLNKKTKSKSFKTESEADKYIEDNYPFPLTRE